MTKSAIYVLTPDAGVNFDSSSAIKSTAGKSPETSEGTSTLGWFRTMIEFEKAIVHQWPVDSQDWAAVSLGSLDVLLRAVTCSPINVHGAGCIIAALNSNLEVTLWGAAKNHLRGEWKKLYDITALLKELPSDQMHPTGNTLCEQVLCICWSPQARFDIVPTPSLDWSLLATGTRGGTVSFFQWRGVTEEGQGPTAVHVQTLPVADQWVTHLAWSPWALCGAGQCEAYLACAKADGTVSIIKVSQKLCPVPSSFGTEFAVERTFEVQECCAFAADKRVITALRWVDIPGRSLILVATKPGIVDLTPWPVPSKLPWSGTKRLVLQRQNLSVDSSPLYPPSGFTHIVEEDILLVSLFDGSFHVAHRLSSDPTLTPTNSTAVTAASLSQRARQVFAASETHTVKRTDVGRISGMMAYDGASTIAWIHETCNPTDFSYKHDARHNSMFMVTQLWGDGYPSEEGRFIVSLEQVLNCSRKAWGYSPLRILRPVFFLLSQGQVATQSSERLLQILQHTPFDESTSINITPLSATLTKEVKREFRNSLLCHMYGWDSFLSLRLKLAVADHCWMLTKGHPELQEQYGQRAHNLLNLIFQRIQRILIRHLEAVIPVLTADDMSFVTRVVVQATLHGSPVDLSKEAQELAARTTLAGIGDPRMALPQGAEEICPACRVPIPLQDLATATCRNGHVWRRCSITSFILSTPKVRTCIGCSRKALIPIDGDAGTNDNHFPSVARGWIVAELLRAVQRCLFCGNSFVSLV